MNLIPPPPDAAGDGGDGGAVAGAVAGGVVALMAVMGLGTLAVLLWQFLRDKRKQQQAARRDTNVQFAADSQPQPLPSTMIELAELPAKDAV